MDGKVANTSKISDVESLPDAIDCYKHQRKKIGIAFNNQIMKRALMCGNQNLNVIIYK